MLGLEKVAKNHFGRKRFTKLAAWLAKAKARSAPDSFFPASPRCAQPEKKQASMQTIGLWRGVEIVARTTRLTINHPSEQLDRRCSQAFSDPPLRFAVGLGPASARVYGLAPRRDRQAHLAGGPSEHRVARSGDLALGVERSRCASP